MSEIPEKYQWLNEVHGLPNTIKYALKEYGVKEIAGAGSTETILAWRDELNAAGANVTGFSNDDIPWCGLFAAIIVYRRVRDAFEVVRNPLWARNWSNYGEKADTPSLGDILVFSRGSGGHVGFYIAEDDHCYHVLAGNQSNKVCILRLEKERLIAARTPAYKIRPKGAKPYFMDADGNVSTDEA